MRSFGKAVIDGGTPAAHVAVTWVTADFGLTGRVARIPLAAARAAFPCVPEDDRQCVRIG